MLQALLLFSYAGEGIIRWHVLEMHSGINEKSLCDLKCAVSYEHEEPHTKPSILAISETTHRKHIKPNEIIMLCKHSPNFIHIL